MYNFNNAIAQAVIDCPCYDGRKSFYGKAKIIETENGRYLQSYNTIVCFLSYGGSFVKFWGGYSSTTMRHINSFMQYVGWKECGGKTWWDSLITGRVYERFSMQFLFAFCILIRYNNNEIKNNIFRGFIKWVLLKDLLLIQENITKVI